MIKFTFDGKEVVPEKGIAISLVRENTYFTKSSTYTLDIKFPLSEQKNRLVFGSINRHDIEQKKQSWNAIVIANGKQIVTGEAIIIEVTDEYVSCQILSGNSLINHNIGEKYIDDLELGVVLDYWNGVYYKAYDDGGAIPFDLDPKDIVFQAELEYTFGKNAAYEKMPETGTGTAQEKYASMLSKLRTRWNYIPNKGVYFLPIHNRNSAEDKSYNMAKIQQTHLTRKESGYNVPLRTPAANFINYEVTAINGAFAEGDWCLFAPQMLLRVAIQRIFEAVGYSIGTSAFDDDPMLAKLIIANSTNTQYLANTLPHWTINEFMDEIEKLFCVVFVVHENKNIVDIYRRSDFFAKSNADFKVIDEFTTAIENEDVSTDISTGNLSYDIPENDDTKWDKINEDYTNQCDIIHCETFDELNYELSNCPKPKSTIFEFRGQQFFKKGEPLTIINQFRNKYNDPENKEVSVTFRIIPASLHNAEIPFQQQNEDPAFQIPYVSSMSQSSVPILSAPGIKKNEQLEWGRIGVLPSENEGEIWDLEKHVDDGDTIVQQQKPNVLPLCWREERMENNMSAVITDPNDNNATYSGGIFWPCSYSDMDVFWMKFFRQVEYSMSFFKRTTGTETIADIIHSTPSFCTTIEYNKILLTDSIIPINSILVIRGKKFVIKSITTKLNDDGIEKLQEAKLYLLHE